MQSSQLVDQLTSWLPSLVSSMQRLPNLHKFQLPGGSQLPDLTWLELSWAELGSGVWGLLLYEDWPETCFRLATTSSSSGPGSIIMGSGALQLCRPININTAGGAWWRCADREEAWHFMHKLFMKFIVSDGIHCTTAGSWLTATGTGAGTGSWTTRWPFAVWSLQFEFLRLVIAELMQNRLIGFSIRRKNAKQMSGSHRPGINQAVNMAIYGQSKVSA